MTWPQYLHKSLLALVKGTFDFGKEILALLAALISVIFGIYLAVISFTLAFGIQAKLWFIFPCMIAATGTPLFLVLIPRYIYWWRYGFPKVEHRSKSAHLNRLRKTTSF